MQATEQIDSRLDPRRRLALAVVLGAVAIDLVDATIVNVAIPSIQPTSAPARRRSSGSSPATHWRSRCC
jgi:hypothetical protein